MELKKARIPMVSLSIRFVLLLHDMGLSNPWHLPKPRHHRSQKMAHTDTLKWYERPCNICGKKGVHKKCDACSITLLPQQMRAHVHSGFPTTQSNPRSQLQHSIYTFALETSLEGCGLPRSLWAPDGNQWGVRLHPEAMWLWTSFQRHCRFSRATTTFPFVQEAQGLDSPHCPSRIAGQGPAYGPIRQHILPRSTPSRLPNLLSSGAAAHIDSGRSAVLLYRVGGPSAVQILHATNFLPSVRHTQRLAARITHRVTQELCDSGIAYQAWEELERAPVTAHFDEISNVQRLVLGPNDEVLGLCEHAPRVYFKTMSDLIPIITNVQNGTWYVAEHARVVAVSRHYDRNYAVVPIACIASCNHFTSEEAKAQTEKMRNLWDAVQEKVGPMMSYATDGDAKVAEGDE